jgi:hypothetical protein
MTEQYTIVRLAINPKHVIKFKDFDYGINTLRHVVRIEHEHAQDLNTFAQLKRTIMN